MKTFFATIVFSIAVLLAPGAVNATTNNVSIHSSYPPSAGNVLSTCPVNDTFYVAWDFTTTGDVPYSGVINTQGDGVTYGDIVAISSYSPQNISGNRYLVVYKVYVDKDQDLYSYKVKFDLIAYDNSFPLNEVEVKNGQILNTVAPLPVTLIDQDVVVNNEDRSFEMNWTTASELNNSHFVISKSVDGQNWDSVGSISGAGTTSETQEYTFIGNLELSGEVYFQLKQVDFDGKSETFPVIKKIFTLDVKPTVLTLEKKVEINLPDDQEVNVTIYGLTGTVLVHNSFYGKTALDLGYLQTGIYFVVIQNDFGEVIDQQKIFLQ